MRKLIENILLALFWLTLKVRYRVTIKGLDHLNSENLKKPGGVLFAPNHPAAFVDPVVVTLAVWKKFPIRPMVVDYMYNLPVVYRLMQFLNALSIPDFSSSSNTLKRKKSEDVMEEVVQGLKEGQNFMVYPAGHCKNESKEVIGGASGVHQIVQECPEANVVLVRTKGLWGSMFSRAQSGKTPPLIPTILHGVKIALKNLLFFTPKREITIEFTPAPDDMPRNLPRLEFNQWLEKWYNTPDGLTEQKGEYPGDSLILVSYSFWKEDLPKLYEPPKKKHAEIRESDIPNDIQEKINAKLAEMAGRNPEEIKPESHLSTELGLDSLDIAEVSAFLEDQFDISGVPVNELDTVSKLYGIASRQIVIEKEEEQEEDKDLAKWKTPIKHYRTQLAHGKTMPEVFLNNCERMKNRPACIDERSGVMTYSQMKMRAALLADYIRDLPGEYIGIMLPASSAAYLTILATQLAGKVPMMVNWTVGPRHLKSVKEQSKVEVILSSWAFVDRLKNVSLDGIEEQMVMLEDIVKKLTLFGKIRAFIRSKYKTASLLKVFGVQDRDPNSPAVLLFTSGTESLPKGVPLSHENVLANQRSAYDAIDLYSDDVIFGILPPFHSFGFTVSGLLGLLGGVRVAYYPNPTEGKAMAKNFERWGVTIMCGAPTFIKNLLKAARPHQLSSMRLCVTGAEKAPPELFKKMAEIGKEQCLIEGYGITETSPVLTVNRTGKPRKGVGEPLPGVELLIVHPESHKPLGPDEEGLILARGPNVFSGYLNPELKSPFLEVNGEQWYNTGDLGNLDEENRLTISGRLKRFMKVGGEMVSLPAIETSLLDLAPELGWPDSEEGPVLAICGKEEEGGKAKIVMFSRFATDTETVNQALRKAGFSNIVKVADVIQVDEIPLMGTGKIHYRALEEKYLQD